MTCLSLYAIFKIDDMQFAIIGIVGETITELIAGIVLVIHNKSASINCFCLPLEN